MDYLQMIIGASVDGAGDRAGAGYETGEYTSTPSPPRHPPNTIYIYVLHSIFSNCSINIAKLHPTYHVYTNTNNYCPLSH